MVERPKLGAAFGGGGSERASGLSGLLAPRPVGQPSSPEPDKVKTTIDAPSAVKGRRETSRAPKATSEDQVSNVVAYLEREVYAAVRVARRAGVADSEPDKSYDQLLVEALGVVTVEELVDHFRPVIPNPGDSLLPMRQRRIRGSGAAQLNFRLTTAQKNHLADLAARVGAPSRSALVDAALRLALLKPHD
jgi:hypothetical protein